MSDKLIMYLFVRFHLLSLFFYQKNPAMSARDGLNSACHFDANVN